MISRTTIKTAGGLLLTLGLGSLPYPIWDNEFADTAHLLGNEAIYWTLVAATFAYVVRVERRPLASIGLRMPTWRDAAIGFVFTVAVVAGLAALYLVVLPALGLGETQAIDQLAATPSWWLAISVARAGVSEEVLFRGYPIERLLKLTRNRAIAILLPLALFALAHVGPWGWTHLLVAAFGGAMFTGLYLWRRNLWINIAAHILVDGIGMLAASP